MRMDKPYKFSVHVFETKSLFIKDFLLHTLFILIETLKTVATEV